LVEGVSLGTVDMTLVTNAPIGNFVQEALFYDLPGLYQDLDHVHAVADSELVQDYLAEALLREDLRLLGVTDGGFRNITNGRGPIETIDDLQGIKMRVQESPMIMATYGAIPGVTPVPVPIGDLYTSLDQGIVDAQENPAILVRDFKFFEVQDHMTLTGHSFFPRHLIINEDIWQSMSEEDQEAFRAAAEEMVQFKNDYYANETEQALEDLRDEGMEVIDPDSSFATEFNELMQAEVYPEFYDEIGGGDAKRGEDIVQQILDMGN
jgi:tripartite ATP-independent transporter DctP family solute receptor